MSARLDLSTGELLPAVQQLAEAVAAVRLPLSVPGVEAARVEQAAVRDQLEDYVMPRLRQMDAPVLAVVGGSTGAGKSTLVNSLLRKEVSPPGVLRPTTRSPVLVHHPQDARWFTDDRVLPSMARVTGASLTKAAADGATTVRLVASDVLRPGLALLDAPDIDSVVRANRELATQLLAAADLWLFVTTAGRYADAVPWDLLRTATARGTTVALVLDRVPPEALAQVRNHLASMLGERGMAGAPLFTVVESTTEAGLLPEAVVTPLRDWLHSLAGNDGARAAVIARTLSGALDALQRRVPEVAAAADLQQAALQALDADVTVSYDGALSAVEQAMTDGTLLRGEVLARWQEFVGTGEFFRGLESRISKLRDRLTAAVRGRPAPEEPLGEALQAGVETLIWSQLQIAADRAERRWRDEQPGRALLVEHPEVLRADPQLLEQVQRLVRDWQASVLDLVREEGQHKRTTARTLSFGVNGLGVLLMLAVFGATGGLTGGEVGIAAGSAALAQRLLEAVFGDEAVRQLAAVARRDLLQRVEALMTTDQQRFHDVLTQQQVPTAAGAAMRAALSAVGAVR